jgi:predicted NAD-dependent protein-ADP-ribosyltransferase YbiA (DUF1768 family)
MTSDLFGRDLELAEAAAGQLAGLEAWPELAIARVALERGQRGAALLALRQVLPGLDAGGWLAAATWCRSAIARALFELGRRREAQRALADARAACRGRGSAAFERVIAAAEREDVAAAGWLDDTPAVATQTGALRDQLRAALRLARFGHGARLELELPDAAIPDGDDHGLDRALRALAFALRSSFQGQIRLAAQHLRRASHEAAAAGADDDLITALFRAWSEPAAAAAPGEVVVIDAGRHELRIGAIRRSLRSRPTLRTLLYAFLASPDRYLSRDAIAQCLWGVGYDPQRNDNSLKSNILRLRAQLAGTGLAIRSATEGYVLVLPPSAELVPAEPRR